MNFGGTIRVNRVGLCIIIVAFVLLVFYMNTDSLLKSTNTKSSTSKANTVDLKRLLVTAILVAEEGGKHVVSIRNQPNLMEGSKGKTKEGVEEFVTLADYKSHCVMLKGIQQYFPNIKVISEEKSVDEDCVTISGADIDNSIQNGLVEGLESKFVLAEDITVWIDPLDATKEYTEKKLTYVTTMVCIAVKGKPVIGVINKPFQEVPNTYWAWVNYLTSNNLKPVKKNNSNPRVIISISHAGKVRNVTESIFGKNQVDIISAAGAGFKSLELVNGNADAYVHLTEIKKWDICAGNAIINAAGGSMTTLKNNLLDYAYTSNPVNKDGILGTMAKHDWYVKKFESISVK